MSDMKLYNILETFDNLESAADKLTPVAEAGTTRNVNIGIPAGDQDTIAEVEAELANADIYFDNEGGDGDTYNINAGFESIEAAEQFVARWEGRAYIETETFEGQTTVQNMGNKVKVTKDGDTTEFDDSETAAEFMGMDDDENSFATEEVDEELDEDAEEIVEGGLGGDMWDDAADSLEFDNYDEPEGELNFGDEPPAEFGISDDEWMVSDLDETEVEAPADEVLGDWFNDEFTADWSTADGKPKALDGTGEMAEDAFDDEDDEAEYSTFDSEDEAHRKRLQRGTPVVLSKELFSDPDGNRRGVFINRSPSGHYGTVVRDIDGKEVNVHLSDIVSADLVNNSIYEEFDLNFEKLVNEEVTMTQTTNLENPENDTTTVTAVGPEAGEELAAMMANAGLNTGEYQDAEAVDTGEPEMAAPTELPMQGMIDVIDAPVEEAFGDPEGNEDLFPTTDPMDVEPSNADLDQIEFDDEFDMEFEESADHRTGPEWSKDSFGNPIFTPSGEGSSELEKLLTKFDDDDVVEWLQHGNKEVDEALFAISAEDMPYGTQKGRTGDPQEWMYERYYEEIAQYVKDNMGSHVGESRDIEHANTPDEREAGVDVVTHGLAGGLNKVKRMNKPVAGGDNAMQRPIAEGEGRLLDQIRAKFPDDTLAQIKAWAMNAKEYGQPVSCEEYADYRTYDEAGNVKEARPGSPATSDRNVGILNDPAEKDEAVPALKRRSQRAGRYLRKSHGMGNTNPKAMPFDALDEELSPENQKKQDELLAKAKADRDWSTSSKGSRLRGKGRGTGRHDRSVKFGLGEDADEAVEEEDNSLVNEHESVDSFLNMYKEFKIRTDKK